MGTKVILTTFDYLLSEVFPCIDNYTLLVFGHLQQNLYDNLLFVCHQKVAHIKVVLLRFHAPQTDHSSRVMGAKIILTTYDNFLSEEFFCIDNYTLLVFGHFHHNLYDNLLFVCHQKVAHINAVLLRFYA